MRTPAWKSLPSWYLVAANDEAIPPDAERQFAARMGATTVEIPSSHVAMVSHPAEVADLVEQAAAAVEGRWRGPLTGRTEGTRQWQAQRKSRRGPRRR